MKWRQSILPKNGQDRAASAFLLCMIPIALAYEYYFVLPHFCPESNSYEYVFHIGFTLYLLFGFLTNYVAAVIVDTSIRTVFIRTNQNNLNVCTTCECYIPLRTYHCRTCNCCILKRDHHCNFTGCCIGYRNQRYFISFLIYLTIGATYLSVFNGIYLYRTGVYPHTILGVFKLFLPLLSLFTNTFNHNSLSVLITLLCIVCSLWAGVFLVHQFSLICKGMVMYEAKKNMNKFNLGVRDNLVEVFGERYLIAWISVFIPSKLPGDGIYFISEKNK